MEIVNKKHESINYNNRESNFSFITIKNKEIYFSASACRSLGLSSKLYAHFVVDNDAIFFYANTDKDGFKFIPRQNKNSLSIMDISLVRYLLKQKPFSLPVSFFFKLTNAKLNGCHLVEILFNKPMQNLTVHNKIKIKNTL